MLLPPGTWVARWAALLVLILTGVLAPAAMADVPPTADFDMTVNGRSVTVVKPGTTVTFTDRSTDSDGTVVQRGWDVVAVVPTRRRPGASPTASSGSPSH